MEADNAAKDKKRNFGGKSTGAIVKKGHIFM
jgi:hypothetical protein